MQTSVARLRARLFRSVVLHPLTLASRSAARHRRLEPGCTVVIVNWNTLRYLVHSVNAVVARSPSSTRILVVDNASADGSQDWVRRHPRAELLALPANVHHGPAMDLGILRCRTRFVVALDVDAFPIRDGWLDSLLAPLCDGAFVSGAGYPPDADSHVQPYVHACCLAIETARFVRRVAATRSHPDRPGTPPSSSRSVSTHDWPPFPSHRVAGRVCSVRSSELSCTTTSTRHASGDPPGTRSIGSRATTPRRPGRRRSSGTVSTMPPRPDDADICSTAD